MSENFPAPYSESGNDDEVLRLQTAVRELADEHVQPEPVAQNESDYRASRFELPAGEYDAYRQEGGFGGITKFQSRSDAVQSVVAVETYHKGGNLADPNLRYMAIALHADGTITSKASIENSNGIAEKQAEYRPAETEPEKAAEYTDKLRLFLHDARKVAGVESERPEGMYWATPEVPAKQRGGRLRAALGSMGINGPRR